MLFNLKPKHLPGQEISLEKVQDMLQEASRHLTLSTSSAICDPIVDSRVKFKVTVCNLFIYRKLKETIVVRGSYIKRELTLIGGNEVSPCDITPVAKIR